MRSLMSVLFLGNCLRHSRILASRRLLETPMLSFQVVTGAVRITRVSMVSRVLTNVSFFSMNGVTESMRNLLVIRTRDCVSFHSVILVLPLRGIAARENTSTDTRVDSHLNLVEICRVRTLH